MMSILRILYLVCWRNRLLIPLIISCATFAMVVTMFYHGSSEEPDIAGQAILGRRKLQPREPQKNHHRSIIEKNDNASPNTDPLAESIQTNSEAAKKLGSNIPDADDLAKKLQLRMKNNRKKEELQKQPAQDRGKERVINPEQGKLEVVKEKWHRNPPNMESNMVFPQQKPPKVEDTKPELPPKGHRSAEKKVNSLLQHQKQGKSNDFFHLAQDRPSNDIHIKGNEGKQSGNVAKMDKEKDKDKPLLKPVWKAGTGAPGKLDPKHNIGGNQNVNVNQMKPNVNVQGNSANEPTQEKVPSLREIAEKHGVSKNASNGNVGLSDNGNIPNGSFKANNSMLHLKPVVFMPGMPVSAHKHKKKVVNFDIKPHRFPKKFNPLHSKHLYRNSSAYLPDHLSDWLHDEEQFCDKRLTAHHGEFARLTNVVLDTKFSEGNKGGESIQSVLNQPEEDEYLQYMYGFFQMPCAKKPDYFFNNNNHINQWLFATRTTNVDDKATVDVIDTKFTIAVVRYEYVNIYHSMTDFYNAFLMMEFYNKTQTETNILVIDGHPKGTLDGVWDVLFNSSQRISQLPKRTRYSNLVWGMLGYNSPMMDHYAFKLPLVEEFRRFFLSSYRVNDSHKLSCDHLTITFIWRRDYVAHPRNPTGTVSRKIANEEELVLALYAKYPNYTIQGMQIDLFDMHDQLQTIAHSDILIGMHGAGLTHAMFLPAHGGLVELLPVYWAAANEHFEAIARWRNLLYQRWVNVDSQYEIRDHVTKVPPDVLINMVTSIISDMCGRVAHRVYPGFGDDTV